MIGAIGLLLINPVMAASFDCSKASNPYEKAVCANPTLSNLDDQLAVVYKNARAKSADSEALKKTQIDWIKATRQCASDSSCIEKAYKDRILALGGGAQPQQPVQAAAPAQPPVAAQNNSIQAPTPQVASKPQLTMAQKINKAAEAIGGQSGWGECTAAHIILDASTTKPGSLLPRLAEANQSLGIVLGEIRQMYLRQGYPDSLLGTYIKDNQGRFKTGDQALDMVVKCNNKISEVVR